MAHASLDLDTVIRRVVKGAKDLLAIRRGSRCAIPNRESCVSATGLGVKYEGYGEATIELGKGIRG